MNIEQKELLSNSHKQIIENDIKRYSDEKEVGEEQEQEEFIWNDSLLF